MISYLQQFNKLLDKFSDKISENFDFDFSSVSTPINTIDDFYNELYNPFLKKDKHIFYRGERINSPDRHLLPTMLRDNELLIKNNDIGITRVDAEFVYKYYNSLGDFVDVFCNTMGKVDYLHLYDICAFSQHYYHKSPLIDFTKSIYPALSFALKNRDKFDDDIVLYSIQINNEDDYTTNKEIANRWLSELCVYVSSFDELRAKLAVKNMLENNRYPLPEDFKNHLEHLSSRPVPKAKLIDVPTNDRMKFQQGVFLLLTDFQLFNDTYLTKNMREQFDFKKYVINKDICPGILKLINDEAPWYNYECLTDVESAFKIATSTKIED